ncbi:DUF2303 family protein [Pacificoceanicola onchidii]|uniref:DUF2303 family protein n=1 Tax=Pacificoceanicola onchidii TaxID=2562685 RepID=UPI0010A48CA6|nr:DUF2303 family protein [Pacificoceanicola onchidii]
MEQTQDPRAVLDATIDAARLAEPVIQHDDGRKHAFIPEGYDLKDVSDPYLLPPHIKRHLIVDDRASLSAYANRFSDKRSLIVADYDNGKITAFLDWDSDNQNKLQPQPRDHSATLLLRDSEEYKRWSKMEGALHSQEDFAFFIEENVADVTYPDASTLLEICRELETTSGTVFKSGVRLDNGDRSFTYETETRVKGEMVVPTEITLAIPLYQGEEPTTISAKFRFRPRPDGLVLGFQWHRVEYQRQAKFTELATAAAEETGLPVFFGRS